MILLVGLRHRLGLFLSTINKNRIPWPAAKEVLWELGRGDETT